MTPQQGAEERIRERVGREIVALPDGLRSWAESHVTIPRLVHATLDPDGKESIDLWLVTGDTGIRDSSRLVAYDAHRDSFGLVERLQGGLLWFLGSYGSFAEAVEGM